MIYEVPSRCNKNSNMYRQKQATPTDLILLSVSLVLFLCHLPVLPAIAVSGPGAFFGGNAFLRYAHILPLVGIANITTLVYLSVKRFNDVFFHQPTGYDFSLMVGKPSKWLPRYTVLMILNVIAAYTIMLDIQYLWSGSLMCSTWALVL